MTTVLRFIEMAFVFNFGFAVTLIETVMVICLLYLLYKSIYHICHLHFDVKLFLNSHFSSEIP